MTGESEPTDPKREARRAASSRGGKIGGRIRAEKLSAERRSEIARKAAAARWRKERGLQMTIGEALHEVRTKAGFSQEKLEELSGIPKARISRYENNHVEPNLHTLSALAKGLGVSAAKLVRMADL